MLRINYKSLLKTTDADLHIVIKCRHANVIRPQGSQDTYCGTPKRRFGDFYVIYILVNKGNVHGWRVIYPIKRSLYILNSATLYYESSRRQVLNGDNEYSVLLNRIEQNRIEQNRNFIKESRAIQLGKKESLTNLGIPIREKFTN